MDFQSPWNGHFPPNNWSWTGDDMLESIQKSPGMVFEIPDSKGATVVGERTHAVTLNSSEHGSEQDSHAVVQIRNRPIPRKGHTKSRRGCFSCKRRKIKCQETHPACGNCEKAGITCEYPNRISQQQHQQHQQAGNSLIRQPQATTAGFSMTDFRLFHHFIVRAHPHLPIGAEEVWTLEVPAFAHEYDFLMRSMLALGASHLSITTTSDLKSQALAHRIEAVNLLNKALTRPAMSKEEADARFASFMILTFQSSCMVDGLIDFLTMLRGCMLQGDYSRFENSAFANFAGANSHVQQVMNSIGDGPLNTLDIGSLPEAVASLSALYPLCETELERRYHKLLMNIVTNLSSSPKAAYRAFIELYGMVGVVPHTDFQRMIDHDNPVSQLLLSHFLASHVLLRGITVYRGDDQDMLPMYRVFQGWMQGVQDGLGSTFKKYNEWPFSFVMNFDLTKAEATWAHLRLDKPRICN